MPHKLAAILVLSSAPLIAATPPFPVGHDPSLFRVTTFASNLPYYPTGFLQLPDGSYLDCHDSMRVNGKFPLDSENFPTSVTVFLKP